MPIILTIKEWGFVLRHINTSVIKPALLFVHKVGLHHTHKLCYVYTKMD